MLAGGQRSPFGSNGLLGSARGVIRFITETTLQVAAFR
jgi:hypothetical protein